MQLTNPSLKYPTVMLLRYDRRRRFHLKFEIKKKRRKKKGALPVGTFTQMQSPRSYIHPDRDPINIHTHTHHHLSVVSHHMSDCIQVWFPILTSHRKP